jgi:hypothetical protein
MARSGTVSNANFVTLPVAASLEAFKTTAMAVAAPGGKADYGAGHQGPA